MVEAGEGFVFLGSGDGDVHIEEVKGRWGVRKGAHKGRRSFGFDHHHPLVVLAVSGNFFLGWLIFLVILGVLEHLIDVKLKNRLVVGVKFLP